MGVYKGQFSFNFGSQKTDLIFKNLRFFEFGVNIIWLIYGQILHPCLCVSAD